MKPSRGYSGEGQKPVMAQKPTEYRRERQTVRDQLLLKRKHILTGIRETVAGRAKGRQKLQTPSIGLRLSTNAERIAKSTPHFSWRE